MPCDAVFDPEEWQAAWIVAHRAKPPDTSPPLGQMVRLIAGVGGFLGRKQDGHPGPKAIWEGLQKSVPSPSPLRLPVPCMLGMGESSVNGWVLRRL